MAKSMLNALLIITLLFSLVIAFKEKEKQISFTGIYCGTNHTFLYMHQRFDCIANDGSEKCQELGLFEPKKQKCLRCCSSARQEHKLDVGRFITTNAPTGMLITEVPVKSKRNLDGTTIALISVSTFTAGLILLVIIAAVLWKYAPNHFSKLIQCIRSLQNNEAAIIFNENGTVEVKITESSIAGLSRSTLRGQETDV